jgi:intracellular septation protein
MNPKKLPTFSKKMLKHVVFSSLLEFGPVIVFLISFEHVRIYEATIILMVATIISTVATYRLQKRIPYLALYVAMITMIFGYMTVHFHKPKFIQMRDTLYDATCALTLIIGILMRVPFLKLAFGEVIPMTPRAWGKITYAWIGYFIIIAVSNEVVRRLFPIHVWFDFKGFVVMATIIFGLLTLYFNYEEHSETKK